jgi:hypothetical protein
MASLYFRRGAVPWSWSSASMQAPGKLPGKLPAELPPSLLRSDSEGAASLRGSGQAQFDGGLMNQAAYELPRSRRSDRGPASGRPATLLMPDEGGCPVLTVGYRSKGLIHGISVPISSSVVSAHRQQLADQQGSGAGYDCQQWRAGRVVHHDRLVDAQRVASETEDGHFPDTRRSGAVQDHRHDSAECFFCLLSGPRCCHVCCCGCHFHNGSSPASSGHGPRTRAAFPSPSFVGRDGRRLKFVGRSTWHRGVTAGRRPAARLSVSVAEGELPGKATRSEDSRC